MRMPKFWHGGIHVDTAAYGFRYICIATCRQRVEGSVRGRLKGCHETVTDSMAWYLMWLWW